MQISNTLLEQVIEALRIERHYVARFKEHLGAAQALTEDPGCSTQVKQMFLGHIEEEETEHLAKLDALLASIDNTVTVPTVAGGLPGLTVGSLK